MITKVATKSYDPITHSKCYDIPENVCQELYEKGLAFPDPVHVTYNLGEKKIYKLNKDGTKVIDPKTKKPVILDKYPILTTIVDWATGDKTIVTNSKCDGLDLDKDGKPTTFAKECGFAFAVTKKMLTSRIVVVDDGELAITQEGFGTKLSDIVNNASDMQEIAKMKKTQKMEAEKRRLEAEKKHAAKEALPKRMSLAQAMDKLAVVLKEIEDLKASVKSTTSKKTTVKAK